MILFNSSEKVLIGINHMETLVRDIHTFAKVFSEFVSWSELGDSTCLEGDCFVLHLHFFFK